MLELLLFLLSLTSKVFSSATISPSTFSFDFINHLRKTSDRVHHQHQTTTIKSFQCLHLKPPQTFHPDHPQLNLQFIHRIPNKTTLQEIPRFNWYILRNFTQFIPISNLNQKFNSIVILHSTHREYLYYNTIKCPNINPRTQSITDSSAKYIVLPLQYGLNFLFLLYLSLNH